MREYMLMKEGPKGTRKEGSLLSDFSDRNKYNGAIPNGKYIQRVYCKFSGSVRSYQDNEMKMWLCNDMSVDSSYNVPRMMAKYHGHKLFEGFFSATNQLGQIRIQAFVQNEGHEQVRPLLKAFVETQEAYGHPLPTHAASDMPSRDKSLLTSEIEPLRVKQNEYDNNASADSTSELPSQYPTCKLPDGLIPTISKTSIDVNNFARSLHAILREQDAALILLGLDTECDTEISPFTGNVCSSGPPALLQIAYRDKGQMKVWLVQLSRLGKKLPEALLGILQDPRCTFCGNKVENDIADLEKRFLISLADTQIGKLNTMARDRGVVTDARVGMQRLGHLLLKQHIDKPNSVRISNQWSQNELPMEFVEYAAIDAIKSLELYEALEDLPDLTARLSKNEVVPGRKVDIFIGTGNPAVLPAAAVGSIKSTIEGTVWIVPERLKAKKSTMNVTANQVLVTVERAFAKNFKIPGLMTTQGGGNVLLHDVAAISTGETFEVILPIRNLCNHIQDRCKNSPSFMFGSAIKKPAPKPSETIDEAAPAAASINALPTKNPYAKRTAKSAKKVTNPYKQVAKPNSGATAKRKASGSRTTIDLTTAVDETLVPAVETNTDADFREAELEDIIDLTEDEMEWITLCLDSTESSLSMEDMARSMTSDKLDNPPSEINNCFQAVSGDVFHLMSRPKISARTPLRKTYKVALMEAWFVWDNITFDNIVEALKKEGPRSDDDIKKLYFFNTALFLACCARTAPPPSILYWRVRAVFAFFGSQVCPETGKPLFNDEAWKKANNVLKEILAGYGSWKELLSGEVGCKWKCDEEQAGV